MNKDKLANIALWLAFFLALVSSIKHLAWTFGTIENDNTQWFGWIPAIAVDAGLAAIAYAIQQRKRAKRSTFVLWCGIVLFAVISAFANLYHAMSMEANIEDITIAMIYTLDLLQFIKATILSATLPAMVIYLGEVVSSDDAAAIEAERLKEQEEHRRVEKELRKLEKEQLRAKIEIEEKEKQRILDEQRTCPICKEVFDNRYALAAHMKSHHNKREHEKIQEAAKS